MSKDYQKTTARTSTPTAVAVVPDVVNVAMNQIAADVREGLLAIAVGAGLQVMAAMMTCDVDALCGPRGRHDPDRTATRHGRRRRPRPPWCNSASTPLGRGLQTTPQRRRPNRGRRRRKQSRPTRRSSC